MRVAEKTAPFYEEFSAYRPTAELIGTFTAWEALYRRTVELQQTLLWHSVGRRTRIERDREQEHRAAIHAGSTARTNPNHINWRASGSGEPLVLLNGWTASGLVWPSGWLRSLEQHYRVIRPDNRGTGWSRCAATPFNIADLADDVHRMLKSAGVRRARVLGLSMGGMIAQELAVRHPGAVEQLILVATQPPAPKRIPSPDEVVRKLLVPPRREELRAHTARMWGSVCAPGFAAAHPDLFDELADQVLTRVTPRALLLEQMRAISGWGGPHRLARITAPTTVVHGAADRLMPVGNGMRLAQLIPGAQYVELRGVGHLVPHEAPDELAEVIGAPAPREAERAGRTPPNHRRGWRSAGN